MTIGAAAVFPGGVVIGADSRLNVAGENDDNYPKAFRIPGKPIAIAVAGEMGLTIKLKDEPDPIEVTDFVAMVRCGLQHLDRDAKESTREAVNALHQAAKAIGYVGNSAQVIVGEIRNNGPSLWMIEHYNTLGTNTQPKETGKNPPYLGIGKFRWYSRLACAKPDGALTPEEIERKKKSPPSALPNGQFQNEASAVQWVRDVIAWCSTQYDDCGGPAVVHVVK